MHGHLLAAAHLRGAGPAAVGAGTRKCSWSPPRPPVGWLTRGGRALIAGRSMRGEGEGQRLWLNDHPADNPAHDGQQYEKARKSHDPGGAPGVWPTDDKIGAQADARGCRHCRNDCRHENGKHQWHQETGIALRKLSQYQSWRVVGHLTDSRIGGRSSFRLSDL